MQHAWNVSPTEAVTIQRALQHEVRIAPLTTDIRTIAGADVSLNMFSNEIFAGMAVMSYPNLEPIEYAVVRSQTQFPYIPGLLSFREIPALMQCLEKLTAKPDLTVVDGQGIAHPRRLGIAAHFGVLAHMPTIGVAKSRLYGQFDMPEAVGEAASIIDPKSGEEIGKAFKSKARSNPLIISPGHLVSVEQALDIVRKTLRGYRLPEPTRRTHLLVNAFRKGEDLSAWKSERNSL